jgi:hypothetical protein
MLHTPISRNPKSTGILEAPSVDSNPFPGRTNAQGRLALCVLLSLILLKADPYASVSALRLSLIVPEGCRGKPLLATTDSGLSKLPLLTGASTSTTRMISMMR